MPDRYEVEADAIITRNRAREIARDARQLDYKEIDLSNVEFVSRSVADELVYQRNEHKVSLVGLRSEVEDLVNAVERSASTAV